jgi:hypothetical protein
MTSFSTLSEYTTKWYPMGSRVNTSSERAGGGGEEREIEAEIVKEHVRRYYYPSIRLYGKSNFLHLSFLSF